MKNRAGFTVIELIIVTLLGSLVVGAAYQVLLVNQRTYTAQQAQIEGQQTVRAGMDVLFGELREISRTGGDIVAIGSDSIRVRSGRNFGLVCAVDYTNSKVDVRKVGSWFGVGDSVVLYVENKTNTAADDKWVTSRVTARDTTVSCNGAAAQRLTIPTVGTSATAGDTIRPGGNVRSFVHYRYRDYNGGGGIRYLGRRDSSNSMSPLVGPLKSTNGVAFRFLDSTNTVTTNKTNIYQIEVTLRTQSSARGPNGTLVADSIKTRINLRN
jgi:prepilin-type N-terminal cleavage/methylation domain-containing protein